MPQKATQRLKVQRTYRSGPPCPQCGKALAYKAKGKRRCMACCQTSPAPKTDNRGLDLAILSCLTCKSLFKPRTRKQQVCSRACRARPLRTCEACGLDYRPNNGDQKRCSKTCRPLSSIVAWWRCVLGLHYYTVNSGRKCECRRKERQLAQPRNAVCVHCGDDYTREPLDGKSIRCLACRTDWNREQVRLRRDKRRARKRDAYVEDVYRAKIYKRDHNRCQLCRKPMNMAAVVPHPRAPTLDHIIPLACGGTHEPSNVQAAHFICNSRKSHQGGGEQLLLIG